MGGVAFQPEQVRALVAGLRGRGVRVGVDTYIRVQRVLVLCDDFTPERLAVALRAVLAMREESEEAFHELFVVAAEPLREVASPVRRRPRDVAAAVGVPASLGAALTAPLWARFADANAAQWPWIAFASGVLMSGALVWRSFGSNVVGRIDPRGAMKRQLLNGDTGVPTGQQLGLV